MLKLKRLIALFIDWIVTGFLVSVPTDLSKIILTKNFRLILELGMIILFIILFFHKDLLFKNASLGKKIMGIGIYDENDQKVIDKKLLVDRNVASLEYFPFYPFMILFRNKSVGDGKFHTKVIENPKVKKQEF